MKFKNLDINILYRVCEELSKGKDRNSVDVDFIYNVFSDIPDENIASDIKSLLEKGLLKKNKNGTQLLLTDRGLSEIRSFVPDPLHPVCDPPKICKK